MLFDDKQITKFQTLYKNRFGKDISRKKAIEQGIKLMRLVEIIYKPMTKVEYKQLQDRRRQIGELKKFNKT